MKITHRIANLETQGIGEGFGLLTDKAGSYFLLGEGESRYQGFFWHDASRKKMFKIIEQINIHTQENVSELCTHYPLFERRRATFSESYHLPTGSSSLICSLSSPKHIELLFDVRESYDTREWGRNYEVFIEKQAAFVRFQKRTDSREDTSHGQVEHELWIAILGLKDLQQRHDWVRRDYVQDMARNSPPFSRYAFLGITGLCMDIIISAGATKQEAKRKALIAKKNSVQSLERSRSFVKSLLRKKPISSVMRSNAPNDTKCAFLLSLLSLDGLIMHGKEPSLFAGLPWFFQEWSRDLAISLRALHLIHPKAAHAMVGRLFKGMRADGSIANTSIANAKASADASGWLCFRATDLDHDAKSLRTPLTWAAETASKKQSKEGLIPNGPQDTWMDSSCYEGDGRGGERIEMQALHLALLRSAHLITSNAKYKSREDLMRTSVRSHFWNKSVLADGKNDRTIRPNLFIAAYVYPDLLSQKEWETCFASALERLWLSWGGVSTIDTTHPWFFSSHSGEDARSYHRGDSWFWLNNLAGLVMHRTNPKKFSSYITQILDASTQEILYHGALGCHAELSSASALRSEGCLLQAWSNAMFAELVMGRFS